MPILYCERINNEYWAEPFNAITNVGFIICAIILVRVFKKYQGLIKNKPVILMLIFLVFAIGIGSWLFHTHATRWAMLTDVIPIALFIILYTWHASRVFCEFSRIGAGIVTGFVISAAILIPSVISGVPGAYIAAIAAMLGIGGYVRLMTNRGVGNRILFVAFVFMISLTFRQLDREVCAHMPIGTHFVWHILNSLVLFMLVHVSISFCTSKGAMSRIVQERRAPPGQPSE